MIDSWRPLEQDVSLEFETLTLFELAIRAGAQPGPGENIFGKRREELS